LAYEECWAFYRGSSIYSRSGGKYMRFIIEGPRRVGGILPYQSIDIRKNSIKFKWSRGKKWISLRYTESGECHLRWGSCQIFDVKTKNLQVAHTTALPVPFFVYELRCNAAKMIEKTEKNILIIQKRNEGALRSFFPALPANILSLISQYATTEWIVRTRLTCKCMRFLNDAVGDREMKSLRSCVLKIVEIILASQIYQ